LKTDSLFHLLKDKPQSLLSKQNICYLNQPFPQVETIFNNSLVYGVNTVTPPPPVQAKYGMTSLTINLLLLLISLELTHLSKAEVQTMPQAKSLTLSSSVDRFRVGKYPNQAFHSIEVIGMRGKNLPK